MKTVCESIYERGSHAIKYLRRRIPADVRPAYPPGRTHITRSLGTSDLREAKALARAESVRIDKEFQQARQALVVQRARLKLMQASAPGGDHQAVPGGAARLERSPGHHQQRLPIHGRPPASRAYQRSIQRKADRARQAGWPPTDDEQQRTMDR